MTLLIIGVALWSAAHLFKRLAPARRAALGAPGQGYVAGALLVSVVLMVLGYRGADGAVLGELRDETGEGHDEGDCHGEGGGPRDEDDPPSHPSSGSTSLIPTPRLVWR